MATIKNDKMGICDDVYTELAGMKERIIELQEKFREASSVQEGLSTLYDRHLRELAEQIEWKLQILSHTCSHDWRGSVDYDENTVSVGPAETFETDFSGGYIGG